MNAQSDREAELLAYLRHLIKRERKAGMTWDQIAEKVGVSRPQVINVKDDDRGAGKKTIDGFARAYHGGLHDALYAAASEHVKQHGTPPIKLKRGGREDLRALVMDAPEYETFSPAVREAFETDSPKGALSIIEWVHYLDDLIVADRRGLLKSGGGRRLKG